MPTRAEYESGLFKEPAAQQLRKGQKHPAAPPFRRDQCEGCGKPIIWAMSLSTGSRSPLDPVAAVMAVRMKDGSTVGMPAREYLADRNRRIMALRDLLIAQNVMTPEEWAKHMPDDNDIAIYVSHFATCPKARDFSHKGAPKK